MFPIPKLWKDVKAWRQQRPAHQARMLEQAVQACSDHDQASLERCLDEGLDVNAVQVQGSAARPRPRSLLALAAEWGFEEGLILLLLRGAEPNGGPPSTKYGQTPLQVLLGHTIEDANLRMGRRLIESGARLEVRSHVLHSGGDRAWLSFTESLADCSQNKQDAWAPVVEWAAVVERARRLDQALPAAGDKAPRSPRF